MNVEKILKKCAEESVELNLDNRKLDVLFDEAPSEELITLLKNNKETIVAFLSKQLNSGDDENRIEKLGIKSTSLSFAQKRLWIIDRMQQGSAEYNMPSALKISGKFNVDVAEAAIQRIIQRHEVLRTQFKEKDEIPYQLVQQSFDFNLVHHDLSELSTQEKKAEISLLHVAEQELIFDLSKDLMIRASYLTLNNTEESQEGILLFNMHHIASDGWSLGVFVKVFISLYHTILVQKGVSLSVLDILYSVYAMWHYV
jgi:hypothetical protein